MLANRALSIWLIFVVSSSNAFSWYSGGLRTFQYVTNIQLTAVPHHQLHFLTMQQSGVVDLPQTTQPDDLEDDRFFLSFVAFGTRYQILCQPTTNRVLHRDAQVNIFGEDGVLLESRTLRDWNTRLFQGRVLTHQQVQDIERNGALSRYWSPYQDSHDADLGWARLTISSIDHSERLSGTGIRQAKLEGVMQVNGEFFTLKQFHTFHAVRRTIDSVVSSNSPEAGTSYADSTIIYRDSDREMISSNSSDYYRSVTEQACGVFTLTPNQRRVGDMVNAIWKELENGNGPLLRKRAPFGCPTAPKVIYMGVAADCSYVSNYRGSDASLTQILSDWNQASQLYKSTFNIELGISKVNLQTVCTTAGGMNWNVPCSDSYDITTRLSDFSQWRGQQSDGLGLWHLMSQCSSGPTIGISWVGQVCNTGASLTDAPDSTGRVTNDYVSGTGVSTIQPDEWAIVAHEIGHNFGSVHDCTSGTCSACPGSSCSCCPCDPTCDCGGEYIMNPTNGAKTNTFSPCTQKLICQTAAGLSCLGDPGAQTTISGHQCGNGVKEPGEDCDCGPPNGAACSTDSCCNGATCKFKNGAVCDDFNDLCCNGCHIKPGGVVCRPSSGVCDVQEVCDGVTGICPVDAHQPDLQSCQTPTSISGQCASGICTSRDLQCQQRGSVAQSTGQCPGYSDQCSLYCQGSSADTCVLIGGFFIDGTSCGYQGKCYQGQCQQSGIGEFISWALDHLAVTIILAVVVGIVVLMCLGYCIRAACYRYVLKRKAPVRNRAPIHRNQSDAYPAAAGLARYMATPVGASTTSTNAHSNTMLLGSNYSLNGRSGTDVTAPVTYAGSTLAPLAPAATAPLATRRAQWVDPTSYNGSVDLAAAQRQGLDEATLAAIQEALRDSEPNAATATGQVNSRSTRIRDKDLPRVPSQR